MFRLTIPHTPQLMTRGRSRPTHVLSAEERGVAAEHLLLTAGVLLLLGVVLACTAGGRGEVCGQTAFTWTRHQDTLTRTRPQHWSLRRGR